MALFSCLLLAALIGQTEGYGGKGETTLSDCLDGGRGTHIERGGGTGDIIILIVHIVYGL